jgi:hypothetical protein
VVSAAVKAAGCGQASKGHQLMPRIVDAITGAGTALHNVAHHSRTLQMAAVRSSLTSVVVMAVVAAAVRAVEG